MISDLSVIFHSEWANASSTPFLSPLKIYSFSPLFLIASAAMAACSKFIVTLFYKINCV